MARTDDARKEYQEKVSTFIKRVRAFLKKPNHHETGSDWPTISSEELSEARQLASDLCALKWAEDCDGDSPIRMTMHDRQRHRLVWDFPLCAEPRQDESMAQTERRLLSNLRTISGAMSSYSNELRLVEDQLERIRRTRLARAAAFQVYLVTYAKPEGYTPQFDRPASLHLSDVAFSKFTAEGFTRKQVQALWAVPDTYADPADNFAEFRRKVAEACEKVVPLRAGLGFASLTSERPTAD